MTVLCLGGVILLAARHTGVEALVLPALLALVFGIAATAKILSYGKARRQYRQEYDRVLRHNQRISEQEEKRKSRLSELEEGWETRNIWYQQEHETLDNLLWDFYSMNLLPAQFHGLAAVCYIYDYMSASQEFFAALPTDQDMERGIRLLEERLDSVVPKLSIKVYETRCIQRNAERLIAQNSRMLELLQRTADTHLLAAQYAALSANCGKADAYFSTASYLKD